ncbi:MAG: hydroxyacylglutathione hydrolase [Chthoniobacter sp.]|jgi:glyoxylase-like metal-dependent hydrolase (beta-lactamase superfamily II)|nr:hydroxyacylglutathione hydrolase [Chthoniobacter sp.]
MIPLEDAFNDIIGKAIRGLKLTDAQVATSAGVSPEALQALREGKWDPLIAAKVAPVLGLGADALVALGNRDWHPEPLALEGLAQFNTPFEDMTVNSYVVWDPGSGEAAAFDTGTDCDAMLTFIADRKLRLSRIFLTHTHGDHIFDLDRLKEKSGAKALVGAREPVEGAHPFEVGQTFNIGGLQVETRLTWGHSKGGVTYVITGLKQPVAVVGDAVFAGSMGGGAVSYEAALETNRTQILSLPDLTILCPGHGPLTTVGDEKLHNPFFT